jgi:hypothetical protein
VIFVQNQALLKEREKANAQFFFFFAWSVLEFLL